MTSQVGDVPSTSNSAEFPGLPHSFSSTASISLRPCEPPNDNQDPLLALFQSLATKDGITLDQLPQLFQQMHPPYGPSEVHNALLAVTTPARLASGVLPFEDVLGLWKNLRASSPTHTPADGTFSARSARRPHPTPGLLQWGKDGLWASTPATWLSIIAVLVPAVTTMVILGFATAFQWRFADDQQVDMLQRQMVLVGNTVTLLSVETNPKLQTSHLNFTVDLLQYVIRFVGYGPAKQQLQQQVAYTCQLLVGSLDLSFQRWSVTQAARRAQWAADAVSAAVPIFGLQAVVRLLDRWNVERNETVVLGQWGGPTGADVELLTATTTTSTPVCTAAPAICNATLQALLRAALLGNATCPTAMETDRLACGLSLAPFGLALVFITDQHTLRASFARSQAKALSNATGGALTINLTVAAPKLRNSTRWVVVSSGWVPHLRRWLAVSAATVPTAIDFLHDAGAAFEVLSRGTNSTERLLLARKSLRNPACIECLTPTYCIGKCLGQNISFEGLLLATSFCVSGDMSGYDWHGTRIISAYACLPEVNGGFALLLNREELQERGLTMVIDYVNRQNTLQNDSTQEIVLGKPRAGLLPDEVKYTEDVDFLTILRYRDPCPVASCGTSPFLVGPMVSALHGEEGSMITLDYRLTSVVAVTSYITSLGVGLVVKEDQSELETPPSKVTVRFLLVCLALCLVCLLALAFLIRLIVSRIQRMWLQWREMEATQLEQRRVFLDCMYPIPVANDFVGRLCLPGREASFMLSLPCAVVFFSDIWGFKVLVNNLTSDQLLSFLGYTFGIMDALAANARVSRVKLVGDSYMAVAGLPGQGDSPCRDMVFFAACCAQAFSDRYVHSAHSANALAQTHSETQSTLSSMDDPWSSLEEEPVQAVVLEELRHFPWWNAQSVTNQRNSTPCIMRYGIAAGPAMAGILPGKVPTFDVFGATVVTASRLERSSRPGRIHVCPEVHRLLATDSLHGQYFRFSPRHEIPARHAEPVVGHFLEATLRPLPPGVARRLGLCTAERSGGAPDSMPSTFSMMDFGNSCSRTMVASSTFMNVAAMRHRG